MSRQNHKRQKTEWWFPRTWEAIRNYCLMGVEFQFYKVKRIMEPDGGKGFTI